MELKYIWVKEYRIIKKLGFNFSNQDRHEFEYKNGKLDLQKDQQDDFLGLNGNVTSITAIAGRNGSGKSSLCEIICKSLATLVNGGFGYKIKFDGIICYGNLIFIQKDLAVSNLKKLKKKGFEIIKYKESPFEEMRHEWRFTAERNGFVYYSNVVDRRSYLDELNLYNISTQDLIVKDSWTGTNYPIVMRGPFLELPDSYKGKDLVSPMSAFETEQSMRFTRFYLEFEKFLPFKNKPRNFLINQTYIGNNRALSIFNLKREISSWMKELLDMIFSEIYHTTYVSSDLVENEEELSAEAAKSVLKKLYRFNLLVVTKKDSEPEFQDFHAFIFQNKLSGKNSNTVKKLAKIWDKIVDRLDHNGSFRPYSMVDFHSKKYDWRYYVLEDNVLKNNRENRQLLKDLIALEFKIVNSNQRTVNRLTNVDMLPYMSSGESSFYSFFSRIYQTIEWNKIGFDSRERFILFIDEGEVNFHPAWKRKFLNWVVEFLNKEFNSYKFQLIVTSHSPYLLSDLPSSNIILLDKDQSGKTSLKSKAEFKTFAGNIHELLADSFFMDEGFIGEFAKLRIESLLEFLLTSSQTKSQNWNKKKARALIDSVSDFIIKDRLQDLYEIKFKIPKKSIQEQRNELAEQSEELKKFIPDEKN